MTVTSIPREIATERNVIMNVDIQVETTINRPVLVIAAYAGDPSNAPRWYRRIDTAVWVTQPPVQVGSQVTFRAKFLGKELVYTYEIVELTPAVSLTMRTAQGPFPMETTYTWSAITESSTRMTLRNHGQPTGFSKFTAPLMSTAMKRAMTQDLRQLKTILETA